MSEAHESRGGSAEQMTFDRPAILEGVNHVHVCQQFITDPTLMSPAPLLHDDSYGPETVRTRIGVGLPQPLHRSHTEHPFPRWRVEWRVSHSRSSQSLASGSDQADTLEACQR